MSTFSDDLTVYESTNFVCAGPFHFTIQVYDSAVQSPTGVSCFGIFYSDFVTVFLNEYCGLLKLIFIEMIVKKCHRQL